VANDSGATLRQLQLWDERGFLVAQREGGNRFYTPAQVEEAIIIKRLRHMRVGFPRIRRLLKTVRQRIWSKPGTCCSRYLVMSRDRWTLTASSAGVCRVMRTKAAGGWWLVDLGHYWRAVIAERQISHGHSH
jgi:hypothetical protein